MSRRISAGIALGISLMCVARLPGAVTPPILRKAAPGFVLRDSNGSPLKLSQYKGKVVLLNFWATTCGGCKVEIPWFMEFASRYKSSGLVVIGVSLDDDGWMSVKPFIQDKKINYPVTVDSDNLVKRYGVESLPMTLLIDRDGKIAASHTGLVDKGACESEIRTLLRDGSKTVK
jgi:cytochrome c biogenesis protein CcmG/thiol:disulfide interchange protein DsbE